MDLMEVPSHITAPKGIELKPSEVDSTQMGAWSTTFIPKGSVYGPFVGEVVYEHNDKKVDYRFAWEVYNLDTSELLHIVNATDARKGNWMRYVNCARFLEEQNFVSVQEGLKVYYKAIKDVKPGEELLTWFEPFKKKRRRRKKNSVDSNSSQESTTATPDKKDKNKGSKPPTPQRTTSVQQSSPPFKPVTGEPEILDRSKRQRKKKKLFDEEILLTDLVFKKSRHRRTREEIERDELEAKLNPKVKIRKRRKKSSVDSSPLEKFDSQGTPNMEERNMGDECEGESSIGTSLDCLEMVDGMTAETLETSWTYPAKKFEYQFDMQSHFGSHITQNGRRMYKCDVCSGIYRHTFSLKRHYLRNHINCKYLSKTDIANCMIVIGQQQLAILKSNSKDILQKVDQALCTNSNEQRTENKRKLKIIKTEPGTEESSRQMEKSSSNSSAMDDNNESNGAKNADNLDLIKTEPVDDPESMSMVSGSKNIAVSMPGLYKCNICYRLFDVVENLQYHTQDHPPVPDVKGFACDKCHMRFTYKQNLVRHHLVHEKEEPQKKDEKKKSPAKKGAPPVPAVRDLDGKPVVHKPFRCSKCPMRFRYQVNLDRHEAIHDADRPYICSYCGKAFPTVTNMKKHEHVHLGSKVPCKYCTAIFVHVGSLRKHIRLEHPDIHRQRLLKLLEKRGKLGTKAAKSLQESYQQDKGSTTCSPVIQPSTQEPPKKEKKMRTSQNQEIDTKFKFACVICKKRFTAYVNMCRHRRLAHKDEKVETKPPETKSPSKTFSIKSLININKKDEEPIQFDTANDPIDDSPEANAQFYANVAANIAENLNCYIDGGVESLSNYKDHILIEDFDSNSPEESKDSPKNDSNEFSWESFNFPKNYNPKVLENNFVHFSECPVPVKEERMDDVTDSTSYEHRAPALCTRRRSSLEGLSSCESSRDGLENLNLKIKKEPVTPTKQDGSNNNNSSSLPAVTGEEPDISAQEKQVSDDVGSHENTNKCIDRKQSSSCKNLDGKVEGVDTAKIVEAADSLKKSEICRTKSSGLEDKLDDIQKSKDTGIGSRFTKYILKLPLLCSKNVKSTSESDNLNTDKEQEVDASEINVQHSNISLKQEVESSKNICEKKGDLKNLVINCGEKDTKENIDKNFGKNSEMQKGNNLCKEREDSEEFEDDCDHRRSDEEKFSNDCVNNVEMEASDADGIACGGRNCGQPNEVEEIRDDSRKNEEYKSVKENSEESNKINRNNSANKDDEVGKSEESCENELETNEINENEVDANFQDEEDKLKCDEILEEEEDDEKSEKQLSTSKQTRTVLGPADFTVGLMISDVKSGDNAVKLWFPDNNEDDNISGCSSPGVYNPPLSSDSDSDMDAETYQRNLNTEILQGLHLAKASSSATGDLGSKESNIPSTEKIYRNLLNMNITVNEGSKASPKHSPFHEFEAIAFGKHGKPAFVCSVCKKHFSEFESMLRHQWKKHPSLACHFLEVEQGHEIEYLYYPEPCNVGVLGASGKSLEKIADRSNYVCTRCKGSFKSVDRLRIHIINCAPKPDVTEPVSPEKRKRRRKRFAKKILGVEHLQRDSDVKPKQRSTSTEDVLSGAKPKKLFLQSPRKRKTSDQIEVPEDLGPAKVKRKRSYDIGYNPGNHVRRREMTEVLDRHQCKGCGVKFKSISLLERHVKKCDGKDKFKDLKVIKSTVNESFHQKMKHTCLYCARGFAYPKTLMNHYKAFCVVKKEKITMGTLTQEEREQEATMMVRLKQQDDDRNEVVTVYDSTEGNRKGWPKGMKRKARRKNHCWTYIKKRKSSNDGDSPTSVRYTPSNDGDTASSNGRYTPSNDSKSTDNDRCTPSDELETPSNRDVIPSNDGELLPELESCSGPDKNKVKNTALPMKSSDQHFQKEKDAFVNHGNKSKNDTVKTEKNVQAVEQQGRGQLSEIKGQMAESKMDGQVKYIQTVTKSTDGSMLVTIRPVVGMKNTTESISSGTGSASVANEVSFSSQKVVPVHSATQTAVKLCSANKSLPSSKSTPEMYTNFNVVPLKSDANSRIVPQVLKIPKPTTDKLRKNISVIKSEISSSIKSASENIKHVVKSPLRGKVQKSDVTVENQDMKVDSVGGNKKGKKKKKNKGKSSQDTVVEAVPLDKELQQSSENSSHSNVSSDITETTNEDTKNKKLIKKRKRKTKEKAENSITQDVQKLIGEVMETSKDLSSTREVGTLIESAEKAKNVKVKMKKQMLEKSEKNVETDGESHDCRRKTRTPKKKNVDSEKEVHLNLDGDKNSNNSENSADCDNTLETSDNKPSVESSNNKPSIKSSNIKPSVESSNDKTSVESSNNKPSVESQKESRGTTLVKSSPKKKKSKVETVGLNLENSFSNAKSSPKRKKKIQSGTPDQSSDNQGGVLVSNQNVVVVNDAIDQQQIVNDVKEGQQSVSGTSDITKNSDGKKETVTPSKKGNKLSGVKAEEETKAPVYHSSVSSPLSKVSDSAVSRNTNTKPGVDNVKCNLNSVFSEDVLSEDAAAVQLLTSLKGTERYPQCSAVLEASKESYPQCNSVQEVRNSDRRAVAASNMAIEDPLSPVSNLLQLAQVAADVLSGVVSMVEEDSLGSSTVKQVVPKKMPPGGRSVSDVHGKSDSTDSEIENGLGRKTPSKKKRVSKSPVKLTTRAELMTKLDL